MATFRGVFYCVITHGELRFCVSTSQKLRNSRRQLKFNSDKTFGDVSSCSNVCGTRSTTESDSLWEVSVISYQRRVRAYVWGVMEGLTGGYSLSFQKKGQTKQKNASGEFSRDLNTKSQQKVLQPLLQITERTEFFCHQSTRLACDDGRCDCLLVQFTEYRRSDSVWLTICLRQGRKLINR